MCTFAVLFHQTNKIMHIRILAFLFFFQSFSACQPGLEKDLPLAANIGFQPISAGKPEPQKSALPASNIIFQSTDGGQSWQDISAGLPKDLQAGCVFADGGEIFLGSDAGLYRSSAAPATPDWQKEIFIDNRITNIFPGRSGPYVCCYGGGLFQEILHTGIWQAMHNTLNDWTVRTVLETPDESRTLFVGCDSGIFKSTDRGNSWNQVFAGGMVSSLVAADGILIGSASRGVLRSTDNGEHWDWMLTEDGAALKTAYIQGRLVSISSAEGPWKEIIAGRGKPGRLRMSADNGKTWQRIDLGGCLVPVRNIFDVKLAGEYLFCSCDAGIFRSADWGKSWELVLPSTNGSFRELAVSGQVIYAVVGGGC